MSQIFNPSRVPQMWSGVATTGAGGLVTVNFPTAFTAAPAVTVTPLTGSANVFFWHLHAVSTTAVTIHATQAASVNLLGINLLTFPSDAVSLEVHIHAIERGNFV